MAEVDLDALRLARAEANKEQKKKPHTVKYKGKTFAIADEMPWDLVYGTELNDGTLIIEGLKQLLGDKQWKQLEALHVTVEDLQALAVAAQALWMPAGEAEASGASSGKTSRRSRQTSNGSTALRSLKQSGANSD